MHILGEATQAPTAGDPGWDAVLAALDSLSSAIRGMRQREARPKSRTNRNR
jgi:hypothetical protein